MKKLILLSASFVCSVHLFSQSVLTLDSCRALAIANNKELLISGEKINAAHFERKAAFTKYLPALSATGTYMRSQKEISMLTDEQKNALNGLGTQVSGAMQSGITQILGAHPELANNPQLMSMLQTLGSIDIASPLNSAGSALVDALRTDTRNIYAGALVLTQPLYMGGKIRAYNKITEYAEELARQQHNTGLQDVILSTDQAYWQVVSLSGKKRLAESYLKLLQKLDDDVQKMIAEGVATKADGLSVRVKVNEAEMTVTKVEDGLSLAKMLLCQLCGIDLTTPVTLADENQEDIPTTAPENSFDMDRVYSNRPEVRSLELATRIYDEKVNVTRSEFLPTLALMGSYLMTNPSLYNGFENKFRGMWTVGVVMNVPIWNWGEGRYKVKAAKAEANISRYQLDSAKEKIELQVNQAAFKVNEAVKKLTMSTKNMEKAEENLRYATLGFEEGVIPTSNVLEAQTAWLSAQSEKIDAQIDVRLTEIYLRKSTGELR